MRLFFFPVIGVILIFVINFFEHKFIYWSIISSWQSSFYFVAGFLIGIRVPDWDFYIPSLDHRSIITHSALLPVLLFILKMPMIATGLALGVKLHLASDIQPKSWIGGALIKCPYFGSIGKILSPLWIFLNITLCLYILIKSIFILDIEQKINTLMVLAVSVFWYFTAEEKKRIIPISTIGISALIIYSIQNGSVTYNVISQFFI